VNPERSLPNVLQSRTLAYVFLLLVIVFFALIRYRLRDMPLERDEGEYALSGQLMLQGIPPYKLAYNLKLPGTYASYAAIMAVFGETPAGIHLGFLLVNAITILLMYILGARLFGRWAGVVAAASYALLSASPSILGFQAHATHFIVLPALVSILLLLYAVESWNPWLFAASGLFAGIAFLMKQHGIFVPVFCVLYLIVNARKRQCGPREIVRQAMWLTVGIILPCATTVGLLYRAGVFRQFWFWTVSYAGEYSKMGLRRGIRVFLQNFHAVAAPSALLWLLAALGILVLSYSPSARKHSFFLIALMLLAFLAICPGVQFRPHYFVLLLPPVSLLAAVAISAATEILLERRKSSYLVALPCVVFLVCFASTIFQLRTFYFDLTPDQALAAAYPTDSRIFLAAPQIAGYVREHSSPSSQIAVIGSEPEIYFYAHRLPATGFIYMYSLTERQKYTDQMRQQMIHEVEANRPEYLIYVDAWDSWGYQRPAAPHVVALFSWAKDYTRDHYDRVGVADLRHPFDILWGDTAKTYNRSGDLIYVFRRRQ